jgi:predicted phosphoribosyltransferase
MPFNDRTDAGRQLARALAGYHDRKPVILALPRGGVTVAAEIASVLAAPLDLILVRKIGVPEQPELAMGAVVDGSAPLIVRNEDVIALANVSKSEFRAVCDSELVEIERRRTRYLGNRERVDIAGRTAIIVDDGVATGATVRAALRATRRRKPAEVVLAVPVGPADIIAQLRTEADAVVCLEEHASFGAIGRYYADFQQVSDKVVIDTLERFAPQAAIYPSGLGPG